MSLVEFIGWYREENYATIARARRAPRGHLLLSCGEGHKVIEIDPTGKTVWELNQNDLLGNPLQLAAGCQVLPNGNLIICNYLGHGHLGAQPQFVEVTRDKKIL